MAQKKDNIMTRCCLCKFAEIKEISCKICGKAKAKNHKAVFEIVHTKPLNIQAIIEIANK